MTKKANQLNQFLKTHLFFLKYELARKTEFHEELKFGYKKLQYIKKFLKRQGKSFEGTNTYKSLTDLTSSNAPNQCLIKAKKSFMIFPLIWVIFTSLCLTQLLHYFGVLFNPGLALLDGQNFGIDTIRINFKKTFINQIPLILLIMVGLETYFYMLNLVEIRNEIQYRPNVPNSVKNIYYLCKKYEIFIKSKKLGLYLLVGTTLTILSIIWFILRIYAI